MNSANLTDNILAMPEIKSKKTSKKRRSNGIDVYQSEITPLLNREGWFYRTAAAGFFASTEPNSADIYVIASKPFVIEIKTAHNGVLSLGGDGGLRAGQLEWAEKFERLTGHMYWLAVVFELEVSPWSSLNRKSSREGKLPRAAFLVPNFVVKGTIDLLPQSSIPHEVGKGMLTEMQEKHLDAVSLWADYELIWNGKWIAGDTHLFHQMYMEEK